MSIACPTMCRLCDATPVDRTAALAQHPVGLRRPVSGNHVERLVGVKRAAELVQEVEEAGFDRPGFVDAKIAQDVVHLGEATGLIFAAAAIRNLQPLAGMRVEEG